MTTLNGPVAAETMLDFRTNVPGTCLATVDRAYGSLPSTGPHAGQYPYAYDGWLYATKRHPLDLHPPKGVPVYYGPSPTRTDKLKDAGDVGISLGDGTGVFTDANERSGIVGIVNLSTRAAEIQRPYLGWTEDFLGRDVSFTATASTPVAPAPAPSVTPTAPSILKRKTKMDYFIFKTATSNTCYTYSVKTAQVRYTTLAELSLFAAQGINLVVLPQAQASQLVNNHLVANFS